MSVRCSVGLELSEPCELGQGLFDTSQWMTERIALLSQRVQAQISRPILILSNCCGLHLNNFILRYESYQFNYGCCDPMGTHRCRVTYNLQMVTTEQSLKYIGAFPGILLGRFICQTCLTKLEDSVSGTSAMSDITMPPEIESIFNYNNIAEIYKYAVERHNHPLFPYLKPDQAEAIHSLLLKQDTLCVMPTGSGKSAVMILPAFIRAKLSRSQQVTLIIYPMNSIINDQLSRLTAHNLFGTIISDENSVQLISQKLETMKSDESHYILCHPETLDINVVRKMLVKFSTCISYVMVDEAHTLYDWSKTFRPAFGRVGKVRTFLNSTIGLFTATFTSAMMPTVLESCRLMEDELRVIARNPDRPEIFLDLRKKTNVNNDLEFLIKQTKEEGVDVRRTIIFLRTCNDTSDLNYLFRTSLPNGGQVLRHGLLFDYLTDHISSSTGHATQKRIMDLFSSSQNCLQILMSTIFYGMGMDNATVQRAVLYDCDDNVASIFQKIGRVGRGEGKTGEAIIFATQNMRSKIFVKGECVRKCILKNLVGYTEIGPDLGECNCFNKFCKCHKCRCCSVCAKNCKCTGLSMIVDSEESDDDDEDDEQVGSNK